MNSTTMPYPREAATQAAHDHLSNAMGYTLALTSLAGAAMQPVNIDGHHFVMVPKDVKREDITEAVEKALPAPTRKRGTVALADVASFITYCKDQARDDLGYIFANPDKRSMTAVFNDNRAAVAGWRDHRAVLQAEYTPEFERWLRNSGQHKSQTEFAEFIEDNFADVAGDDAQLLLNVATTIQAKTDINFSSAKRLESGQVQLTYNEVINATAIRFREWLRDGTWGKSGAARMECYFKAQRVVKAYMRNEQLSKLYTPSEIVYPLKQRLLPLP